MEQQLTKILGEVPFPSSQSDPGKAVGIYYNSSMAIIDARQGVDFPSGYHLHDSYEFTVFMSSLEVIILEANTVPVQFNRVLPINPGQMHGSAGHYPNCSCFGWHIETQFVKDIASAMYGKPELAFDNDFIPISKEVNSLLRLFMEEYRNKQAGMHFVLDVLAAHLTSTLLRQINNSGLSADKKRLLSAKPNIERTIEYLHDNYQSHYSLSDVAHIANLSPYHFLRLFKNQTGKTPYAYLVDIKIEKAKELLKSKKYTVTEVCFLCGFNNTSHFATLFKKMVGLSPSDFRKL
jgi:AraC-like DNA-binding protein